jgi:hypothetical protein
MESEFMAIRDRAEMLALKHLKERYLSVIHEPDGVAAPDFLVDGRYAVEVRRLNQNIESNGEIESLEETAIPLAQRVQKLLKKLGPPKANHSWFVDLTFSRPIPEWKVIKKYMVTELEKVKNNSDYEPTILPNTSYLRLGLMRTSTIHEDMFLLGGYDDRESGGWVVSEFERNLIICIEDKNKSINRDKYKTWWLLLVDLIGNSLDKKDREYFKSTFHIKHDWDKIIIIDPANPANHFEI